MAREIMLKIIDGDYKVNEVTGDDMGGEQTFYIPFSSLQCSRLELDAKYDLNHSFTVTEIGEDYAMIEVAHRWGSTTDGPYKVCLDEEAKRCSYYFGEWNYYYSLSILWHAKDEA